MLEKGIALKGVCHFFSETGTEGGDWAFQDERYIQKNFPRGWCKKCGKVLVPQSGPIQLVRVDQITEETLRDGKVVERPDCPDNNHEEDIGDRWSYEGLHCLENGDSLTIYSKENPNEVVWSGVIKLKNFPLFTEHASGLWIHADQMGIERETWAKWFFEGNPAILVVNEFREFLRGALRNNPGLKLRLAEEFHVALSTVDRWASGTANPHPRYKEMVRRFISKTQK